MSEQYKFNNSEGLYFVTSTVIDWVDLFIRKAYKLINVDSLTHCMDHKGLIIND